MSEIVDCIAWIIQKTCWSFWICMKFITLRILDLIGLVLNIAACATLLRLPAMVLGFQNMDKLVEWRIIGLVNLMIFLMDVPVIIMGFIIFFTFWRIPSCWKDLKEEWDGWEDENKVIFFTGFEIRGVIVKHFFTLFIDVFCVPSAIITLLSWRCCIFLEKMKKADDDWERRKICFKQCVQVFVDIPLIIFFLIAACSWRLPFLIFNVRKKRMKGKKWNNIRYCGIVQVLYLLADLPCFVLSVITLCTWRCPVFIWQLCGIDDDMYKKRTQWELRKMIVLQFLYIFVDIPCIVVSVFLLVTIWRLPSLYHLLVKVDKNKHRKRSNFYKKEFKIRGIFLQEFCMLLWDFFSFVMFIFVLLALWRTYPMIKDLIEYLKRYQKSNKPQKQNSLKNRYGTFESVNLDENKSVTKTQVPNEIEKSDEHKVTPEEHQTTDIVNEIVNEIVNDVTTSENDLVTTNNETLRVEVITTIETSDNITDEGKQTETDEAYKKKMLSWRKCMFKIRKSIAMHFAMFFVDVPAIPLSFILLITGLRTSTFISKVIASGNFYMFFAVTVYYQTFRLFIDLLFLLLFVVLMLLRPIQAWVHLLEDEEHKHYRLVKELLVWIPDICNERQYIYELMDEEINVSIKRNIPEHVTKTNLESTLDQHLSKVYKLSDVLKKNEIQDELGYLLECVVFWEKKRSLKLLRKFGVEKSFILRTDISLHKNNLHKLDVEMREYEQSVNDAYKQLQHYCPAKVPLYETKSGLSLRSRKETRKVLINCLPRGRFIVYIMALLCCLPLYRAPGMIYRLLKRPHDKFNIVLKTLKEYALDFLTLLRILLVLAFLYRAPLMIADIIDSLVEKRSWKAVRSSVKKYPVAILEDIISVTAAILSWKTPRFIFASILFGVLMPADMLLTVIKLCVKNGASAYLLTIFVYILIMGFPIGFGVLGAEKLLENGVGWINVILLCIFCAVLLCILSLMMMSLVRDQAKTFVVQMPPCDYVRFNWTNVNVFIFEIVEFLQAFALIFKLADIPMYGSDRLKNMSEYLLFSFLPFKVVFWLTIAMFVVWFFLCAAPIIFENVLEEMDVGTCAKRTSWRLAVSIFANTLFVSFVENFISFSACKYETCPSNYTIGNIPANSSCTTALFIEDNTFQCWSDSHMPYAVTGLVCLVWYISTALVFDTKYGDPDSLDQDIGFSPVYNTGLNVFKAVMVVVVSIVTNSHYVVITIFLICNFGSVIFTLLFRTVFRHEPCNLPSILVWRLFTFISCIITVVAVLVSFIIDDNNSKIPLVIIGVGILFTFIVSIITAVYLRRESEVERDRTNFRKEILALESRLSKNKWLPLKWRKERAMWLRLVKTVHKAGENDKNVNPSVWMLPPSMNNDVSIETQSVESTCGEAIVSSTHVDETISLPQVVNKPQIYPPQVVNQQQIAKQVIDSNNVYRVEKTGRHLLAILEQHIRYEAYRYSFILQRHVWCTSLIASDWTGLLQCLRILDSNINGSFNQPTHLDVSLSQPSIEEDELKPDVTDTEPAPPVFIRQTKEMLAQLSAELRQKAIDDFAAVENHGVEWSSLLNKLLPTLPVITSWTFNPTTSNIFELTLRRSCTATITEIDSDRGNKLAKGASFTVGKIFRGRFRNDELSFDKGFSPVAKKGPVSVTVTSVSFVTKGDALYICVNGKKVKYDVAIASCKTLQWK